MVVQSLLVPRQQPDVRGRAEHQAPDTVVLRLEDPRGIGEAFLGQRGEHRFRPRRLLRRPKSGSIPRGDRPEHVAHRVPCSSATCSIVRPEITDSGRVRTGFRRASARSSASFTSSQRGRSPFPILVRAYPPESLHPSRPTETWPPSTARSNETDSTSRWRCFPYVPVSQKLRRP